MSAPLQWRPFESAPRDGTAFYVRVQIPMRFKLYKPTSTEYRSGKLGRWQQMSEYGGWVNCPEPDAQEWAPHPKDVERFT